MRNRLLTVINHVTLFLVAVLVFLSPLCAQTEIILYRFTDGMPNGGLIADAAGNLYGTNALSNAGMGSVFELSDLEGVWSENALHIFLGSSGRDGEQPAAGLVADSNGNLFGTTQFGGIGGVCTGGCGTVFELIKQTDGSFKYRVIYRFTRQTRGQPVAGLVIDSAGNLYGTTTVITDSEPGTVFELSPGPNGIWTQTVLYRFRRISGGSRPTAPVVLDIPGSLYGTTTVGGQYKAGTVYKLSPGSNGWTYTAIYAFGNGSDGATPTGGLVLDAAGNLYGTTSKGGTNGVGIVFKLSPAATGRWKETILHEFSSADGENPSSSLIFDPSGNLYGVAPGLGMNGNGTVFELSPSGDTWNFTVLFSFNGSDGSFPRGPLLDIGGNLYGIAGPVGYELIP